MHRSLKILSSQQVLSVMRRWGATEPNIKSNSTRSRASGWLLTLCLFIGAEPAVADLVFSEDFEDPKVSGYVQGSKPVPWVKANQGYNASFHGLVNKDGRDFSDPDSNNEQGYSMRYTNTGLTTAEGVIDSLQAGGTYTVTFDAVMNNNRGGTFYRVQLIAFGEGDLRNDARSVPNNSVLLAETAGNVPADGNFYSYLFELTTDAATHAAAVGKDIGIRLVGQTESAIIDNVTLNVDFPYLVAPEYFSIVPAGTVTLEWTNKMPNAGSDVWVDVWFGTDPANLTKVVDAGLNLTTVDVSAPVADTYYWRVDSYLDGSSIGTADPGNVFIFHVNDTDNDGLPDLFELQYTNPQSNISMDPNADDDGDGLTNLQEYQLSGDPTNADMDGDGLNDGYEINTSFTNPFKADTDGDGLDDGVEVSTYFTNPTLADTDSDGLPDGYEVANSGSGTAMDPAADDDSDTLSNLQEYALGTDPNSVDSDGDGLGDASELAGVGSRGPTDPLLADTDSDGLNDNAETNTGVWASATDTGTNPNAKDTDQDGLVDGVETNTGIYVLKTDTGTSPLLADTDTDGANDWYEVASATFTDPNDTADVPEFGYPLPDPDGQYGNTTAPIKVYILAGQSNMVGMGELGSGAGGNYPLGTPGTLETITQLDYKFPNLIDGSNNWTTRNDVYIYEARLSTYPYQQGGITPGVVNGSSTMGPEIQFGHIMGEAHDEQVILIKVAQGNRSLAWDFRPPSSGRNDPASPWESLEYTLMIDGVNDVLNNLATIYPNYIGQGYEIAGFFWFQGHKDTTNTDYADEYEINLVNLINDVRSSTYGFGVPDLPVVVATIGFDGYEMTGNASTVWQAQRAIANPINYPQFDGNVASVDTRGLWREASASPKSEDYHYNRNAETYALVGDAAGRAMYRMVAGLEPLPFGADLAPSLNALTAHVTGTEILSDAEIENRFISLKANLGIFANDAEKVTAAINFIQAYDANIGALWTAGSPTDGGWDRDSVGDDIHRAAFLVMQAIMDELYTANSLSAYETLLDGYKFASADFFPGAVAPPASIVTHTATINASYLDTAGWDHQNDDLPARKPTGAYLAPGTIVTVTVPPALVNSGYQIRVGGHYWDMSNRKPVRRLDRVSLVYDITSTSTKIANPLGGGIYIDVPKGADGGIVNVDITGAVRSPYFSAKSFHTTTLTEWQNIERNHPAPWADFQTGKFMMMVPRDWIYNWDDPAATLAKFDTAMDMINDLMGFPRDRGKETMYPTVDLLTKSSVYAPGYPSVNVTYNPDTNYGGLAGSYLLNGPQNAPYYFFHEKGHGYGFPKFGGESESNVNLLHVAVLNRGFSVDMDYAFADSLGFAGNANRTLDNTAVTWMTSFNFTPRELAMADWEKAYQLKGHAKFVDIAQLFGWEKVNAFYKVMTDQYDANGTKPTPSNDDLILQMAQVVGEDIRPLLHFWGIFPSDPAALEASIQAASLPVSNKVYDRLVYYKSLVPANNAEFQAFTQAWWGAVPSINGAGTEREHARQYDGTNYWEPNFWTYSGTDPNQLDGEIYNPDTAARIQARVDALLAQYFPGGDPQPDFDAPNPNPMTFEVAPYALNEESVTMTATEATDEAVVEYYFTETSGNPGGDDSGWQNSRTYTDTGLQTGLTYTYTVTARDKSPSQNTTDPSAPAGATTLVDNNAPTPDPMTWVQVPVAAGGGGIALTENFESPVVSGYSQGTLPDNGNWVGSNNGFGSNQKGVVNKDSGHFSASDPNIQAFAFRYTNSGITTAEGVFGYLANGVTYNLSFDVVRDDGKNAGTPYRAQLIAFPAGANRADHTPSGLPVGAVILAEVAGDAPSDGTWATVNMQFTADPVANAGEIGMDLGVRFIGASTSAIIDNFSIDTGAPYITMEASVATDAETGANVEYYFTETSGNPGANDSGWQASTTYTDTGLADGYTYTYTVKARDMSASLNETAPSAPASATTGGSPPVNNAPVFGSNPFSAADATEDAAYSGSITGSATDIDVGDVLSYSKASGPAWLSVAADGILSGTPTNADVGVNSFTVQVSDGKGGTDTATLNITVLNVNDAPVFSNDPIIGTNATENVAYSGTIAGSASDADGDTLTYSKVSGPAWLSVAVDGTLSGTPSASDIGANSFTVQVADGNGGTDTATLNITVVNVNDAPVFGSDPITGANATENVAYSGTIAGSASDADGDTLTYTKVSGPAWLSVATNGTLSGTPSAGDVGANSFTVQVADGNGGTDTTTLNIMVDAAQVPTMYVNSVVATAVNIGQGNKEARVSVVIYDGQGNPLSNATVTVELTGAFTETLSGVTNASGTVELASTTTAKGSASYTATVTDVTHPDNVYDPGSNMTNSGSN